MKIKVLRLIVLILFSAVDKYAVDSINIIAGNDWINGYNNPNIIQPNDDLNDYINPGTYISRMQAVSKTLLNCPYKIGNFKLFVIQNTGEPSNGYFLSQIILTANGQMFIRGYNKDKFFNWKNMGNTIRLSECLSEEDFHDWTKSPSGYFSINDYTIDNELLTQFPNVYKWGTLLNTFSTNSNFAYQLYIPDKLDIDDNGIYIRNIYQSSSTNPYREWICIYKNDYKSISLNQTGYIAFRNGLKIQWIRVTVPANNSSYEFTFPIQENITTIAQAAHCGSDKVYFLVSAVGKNKTTGIIYPTNTTTVADYNVLLLGY